MMVWQEDVLRKNACCGVHIEASQTVFVVTEPSFRRVVRPSKVPQFDFSIDTAKMSALNLYEREGQTYLADKNLAPYRGCHRAF
jgi:hypothetical protein